MLAALFIERLYLVARLTDRARQSAELVRHLAEQLHDRSGAGRSRECSGLLSVGQLRKPRGCHLNIRQKALRRERIAMRLIEVAVVGLQLICEMLIERGRAGKRGGVEPGG